MLLVNAGIVQPSAVLMCPFIAATTGANSGFGDFQWKSPFDTWFKGCFINSGSMGLRVVSLIVGQWF
jgi:hypothetical protein